MPRERTNDHPRPGDHPGLRGALESRGAGPEVRGQEAKGSPAARRLARCLLPAALPSQPLAKRCCCWREEAGAQPKITRWCCASECRTGAPVAPRALGQWLKGSVQRSQQKCKTWPGAPAPAPERIQRDTWIHNHSGVPHWGHRCCPRAELSPRAPEHSRDGFALWAELISALISEGWSCIHTLTFQSPGRKGRWAPAGCEC